MPARRTVLRASLGATAAGLMATAGTGSAMAAGRGGTGGRPDPELPDIPGMKGDRRANELWYRLDQATLYHPSKEFTEAYEALVAHYGKGWDGEILNTWRRLVTTPGYQREFTEYTTPAHGPFEVMSRVQLEVFDSVYDRHDPRLAQAFGWFGQGVLYDPRTEALHVMTGHPPGGYPVWHAILRAMMFLDIDTRRWAELAPLNAFGCAVQLYADPDQENVNPPLPEKTVRRLAAYWLPRGPEQLDVDYQSFPYPEQP